MIQAIALSAVTFICHGYLNSSQFNYNVPAHFKNILLKAERIQGNEDLKISVAIGDSQKRFTETYMGSDSSGTAYPYGAHLNRPDGGFFYLTYDLPLVNRSPDTVFKALFVYAERKLDAPDLVRARFTMYCSEK